MPVKISELPASTHIIGSELGAVVQSGETRNAPISSYYSGLSSQISGDLSNVEASRIEDSLTTLNTSRGIQPIRSGASLNDLYPVNLVISNPIFDSNGDPIPTVAMEAMSRNPFVYVAVLADTGTLQLTEVGNEFVLEYDGPGQALPLRWRGTNAGGWPADITLSPDQNGQEDQTITASPEMVAPKLGDRGMLTGTRELFVWNGESWVTDGLQPVAQTLTVAQKSQLAANWPEAVDDSIKVLVIGQSNIANGRPGGTIVFNPEVKIWTVAENPNATVDEFQPWDLSLDPPQHSHPAQSGILPAPVPDPDYQKWSHVLANKIQRFTRRPVHIVQAAESGRSIDHWITTANGGSQEWWDWIVQETADAGIKKYDFLFFDHGESGTIALANYETAMRALRQQLEDAGYIDDSTVFLSREVTAGLVNSQAAALVFIDERNGNGNMIDRDLLTTPEGDALHIDGESHELVGLYHFDWLLERPQSNTYPNFGTAIPTAKIQGSFIVQVGNDFKKIPAIEFTANPYPATPDLVFYGEDYVTGSNSLAGGVLTLTGTVEPTVNTNNAGLSFGNADSTFETSAALLSASGDWLVGFRIYPTPSGVNRRDIWQQYSASDPDRTLCRIIAGELNFVCGDNGGLLDYSTTEVVVAESWNTVIIEKVGNTIKIEINGVEETTTGTLLGVEQRIFELGQSDVYPIQSDIRKFIVYNRSVTATEKAAVKTWLDSL